MTALSPDDLKKGTLSDFQPLTPEIGLMCSVRGSINADLTRQRAARIHDNEDIESHYVIDFPLYLVDRSIVEQVLDEYREAGWTHSCIQQDHIVIAREPFGVLQMQPVLAAVA